MNKNMNGATNKNIETVIATGDDLLDALSDALLQIKPRKNTKGRYTVIIQIEEVNNNGNKRQTNGADKGN